MNWRAFLDGLASIFDLSGASYRRKVQDPPPKRATDTEALAGDWNAVLPSFTCPRCTMTSYNPNDIREGYCGNCHDWTREK
jgi:hypothetical protein